MTLALKSFAISASYDERLELIGVISYLSGFNEYGNHYRNPHYFKDINDFFESVKKHPVTSKMQQLRKENGIGYDAPMSLALHLKKYNEQYKLSEDCNFLEERWNNINMDTVIALINDFYKESNFSKFYNDHQEYYQRNCIKHENIFYNKLNESWYTNFYGTSPEEKFEVYVCFTNGGQCYGIKFYEENNKPVASSIIGAIIDEEENVFYEKTPDSIVNLIVHEFNHSFINPLLDVNAPYYQSLKNIGPHLAYYGAAISRFQPYKTWETISNESLVRAVVLNYLIDNNHSKQELQSAIDREVMSGFVWVPMLAIKLEEYKNQRDKYPTLRDFYPEIVKFYHELTQPQIKAITSLINQAQ